MTDKEEIIIDGEKEKVNILFECNHIDDLEAYSLIKKGIEITPENAPINDFKISIISNIHSPYGFSSICQRSKKSEDWEYLGFGHSGACSVTTALLKELSIKTAECEKLKAQLNDMACMDDDNVLCYPKQELKKEYDEYVLTHKYSNEEFQQERKAVADLAFWSNRYKRGLEEIEKELKEDIYCENQECGCDDFEECLKCTKEHILDIINKAKDGNNV